MGKRYKTAAGDYLVTEETTDGVWRIWWHIAEWGDSGGCLGENERSQTPPKDKDSWEGWQADRCVEELADGRDTCGFYFESKRTAHYALAAANEGLFTGDPPLPAWAQQAKAEGWTPPKGWKP